MSYERRLLFAKIRVNRLRVKHLQKNITRRNNLFCYDRLLILNDLQKNNNITTSIKKI